MLDQKVSIIDRIIKSGDLQSNPQWDLMDLNRFLELTPSELRRAQSVFPVNSSVFTRGLWHFLFFIFSGRWEERVVSISIGQFRKRALILLLISYEPPLVASGCSLIIDIYSSLIVACKRSGFRGVACNPGTWVTPQKKTFVAWEMVAECNFSRVSLLIHHFI